ncbi:MAG: HlyD family efflux transporter periplasmic adaptor subunit [Chitinophagia bacterium]|nr:HlyD family efflux transporter periplasmic adaptor subunit [Chitinophagia bacterium]NDD17054.1 HlyD family efflux transporter periplasmic adaptor subunit [Chitinophagia bacterium]
MNKKVIWISVAVIAIIALLVGLKKAGIIGKVEGTEVTTEKVQLRTITESVNASGKVYPEVEVKVSPDISGEIVNLYVEEGDKVTKGQVLAKIYADIYSSQRDQVTASVNQVKAQYENVKAALTGLKTAYENTKATNERYKKLFADKIVSRSEYEQTEQAFRSAESSYNSAKESIKSGEAQIQGVKAQLARAEKDLARTIITCPMDGIISLMNVKKGERVVGTAQMTGTEMMRVADMKSIEVRVDVGENDITKVKLGDTALVEVDAYNNRKFKGIVYKIANPITSTANTTASSAEVANYKVHIRLLVESYSDLVKDNNIFPFRPGMTASADIQTKSKANVVTVPLNAVTTRDKDGEGKDTKVGAVKAEEKPADNGTKDDELSEVVFVLGKDNKVKMVKVKTDIQDLNYIEIIGLKVGEEVITGPYSIVSKTLKDGMIVKVVTKDKLFEEKK